MSSILAKLENIIFKAFDRYELEEQKRILEKNKRSYAISLQKFFTEIFLRLDQSSIFLSSFYDDITRLYLELGNNEVFISKIINYIIQILNEDKEIRLEILYSGKKNSFDLIINYTLGLLDNVLNISKVDSSKLLQLVNFYDNYDFAKTKPRISQLKRADSPQRLIKERFLDIHKRKVYEAVTQFTNSAQKINNVISDSSDYAENNYFNKSIPSDLLKQSWGGQGSSIYSISQDLDIIGRYFGRTEDSIAGEAELIDKFLSMLRAASFGSVNAISNEFVVSGNNFFGKFNLLFAAGGRAESSLWGLNFLRPLTKTRAYQSVDLSLDPIEYLFKTGIKDRLGDEKLGKKATVSVLPISLYIESLLKHAKKIGGYALSLLNSLDSNGRLRYYEGLGNLKYPLESLVAAFPVATISCGSSRPNTGIVGALENILTSITAVQNSLNLSSFPGKTLEEMVPWFDSIKNKVEMIFNIIKVTGYKAGDLIPDVPLQVSGRTREDYTRYFKSIGYSDNKIEKILNSRNLTDLVVAFEGRMSSDDVKSFLQGYDLSKFIYSIAGEEGITAVIEYLTSPDEEQIARLFSILDVRPDRFLKLDQYKYGKLIGSLLSIEKAANISSIEKLIPLLRAKNSTIGQSLKIISDFGLDYPIRNSLDIPVLETMLNQLSRGYSEVNPLALDYTCKEALVDAPESLRQWVRLIDSSKGEADATKIINLLQNTAGITYTQLGDILNSQDSPGFSLLSGILEGFEGGEFTQILRSIYKSGLAVLMRDNASYSKKKIRIVPQDTDDLFLGLIDNLEKFSIDSQLINYRLLVSSEESSALEVSSERGSDFSVIFNLINKPISTSPPVIQSLGPDPSGRLPYKYNKTLLKEILELSPLLEPPGTGNSPRLTRRYSQGVLSPELAFLLETPKSSPTFFANQEFNVSPLVKIDRDTFYRNKFSDIRPSTTSSFTPTGDLEETAITPVDGIIDVGSSSEEYRDGLSVEPLFNTSKFDYFNPLSDYITDNLSSDVSVPISGSYVLDKGLNNDTNLFDPNLLTKKYDPVKSCTDFGTSEQKCKRLFKDYEEVDCKEYLYNKSSLIEPTPNSITQGIDSIPLSRPLGVTGSLNPSATFVPNSYKRLPAYVERSSATPIALNSDGEPLGVEVSLGSEQGWENTSIGLNHFLENNPRPKNEQECSRYSDVKDLRKCINILRCLKLRERGPKFCNGLEL